MVTNLFSSFDPSTSQSLALNWLSTFIPLLLIPSTFWTHPLRSGMTIMLTNYLNKELNASVYYPYYLNYVKNYDLWGLFPFIFTPTNHMVISLSMALPLWVTFMLFGWLNNTNKMFAHLLPNSTPVILMSFMILIETVSNVIRPITLSIRLTANMIAGHLLLTLLGNQGVITFLCFYRAHFSMLYWNPPWKIYTHSML